MVVVVHSSNQRLFRRRSFLIPTLVFVSLAVPFVSCEEQGSEELIGSDHSTTLEKGGLIDATNSSTITGDPDVLDIDHRNGLGIRVGSGVAYPVRDNEPTAGGLQNGVIEDNSLGITSDNETMSGDAPEVDTPLFSPELPSSPDLSRPPPSDITEYQEFPDAIQDDPQDETEASEAPGPGIVPVPPGETPIAEDLWAVNEASEEETGEDPGDELSPEPAPEWTQVSPSEWGQVSPFPPFVQDGTPGGGFFAEQGGDAEELGEDFEAKTNDRLSGSQREDVTTSENAVAGKDDLEQPDATEELASEVGEGPKIEVVDRKVDYEAPVRDDSVASLGEGKTTQLEQVGENSVAAEEFNAAVDESVDDRDRHKVEVDHLKSENRDSEAGRKSAAEVVTAERHGDWSVSPKERVSLNESAEHGENRIFGDASISVDHEAHADRADGTGGEIQARKTGVEGEHGSRDMVGANGVDNEREVINGPDGANGVSKTGVDINGPDGANRVRETGDGPDGPIRVGGVREDINDREEAGEVGEAIKPARSDKIGEFGGNADDFGGEDGRRDIGDSEGATAVGEVGGNVNGAERTISVGEIREVVNDPEGAIAVGKDSAILENSAGDFSDPNKPIAVVDVNRDFGDSERPTAPDGIRGDVTDPEGTNEVSEFRGDIDGSDGTIGVGAVGDDLEGTIGLGGVGGDIEGPDVSTAPGAVNGPEGAISIGAGPAEVTGDPEQAISASWGDGGFDSPAHQKRPASELQAGEPDPSSSGGGREPDDFEVLPKTGGSETEGEGIAGTNTWVSPRAVVEQGSEEGGKWDPKLDETTDANAFGNYSEEAKVVRQDSDPKSPVAGENVPRREEEDVEKGLDVNNEPPSGNDAMISSLETIAPDCADNATGARSELEGRPILSWIKDRVPPITQMFPNWQMPTPPGSVASFGAPVNSIFSNPFGFRPTIPTPFKNSVSSMSLPVSYPNRFIDSVTRVFDRNRDADQDGRLIPDPPIGSPNAVPAPGYSVSPILPNLRASDVLPMANIFESFPGLLGYQQGVVKLINDYQNSLREFISSIQAMFTVQPAK